MATKNIYTEVKAYKQKEKKGGGGGGCFECGKERGRKYNKRFLVSVAVLGSAGPLRFLVNEEDVVRGIIDTTLKLYAKEGRLPLLGTDPNNCILYSANSAFDALGMWEEIGSSGARNFVLCKKPEQGGNMTEARAEMISRKGAGGSTASWKSWINKSLSFKVSSH